jgi:phage terminase small subunit
LARPRKPTEVLELSSAFVDQPGRRRPLAPRSPHPVGDPPAGMDPEAAGCWREIVGAAPPGVLTAGDRLAVEIAAALIAKFRRGEATAGEAGLMLRALTELGMTPASRSKVAPAGPDKPEDATPWGFLKRN